MTSSTASLPRVKLRIGSKKLSEGSGGFHDHVNPATVFETGRSWKPSDRRDALIRVGDLIERNASELVRLRALDLGSATASVGGSAQQVAAHIAFDESVDLQLTRAKMQRP